MLSCTGKRSHRHTILHVSFSNSFGLASARPTPQGLSGAPDQFDSLTFQPKPQIIMGIPMEKVFPCGKTTVSLLERNNFLPLQENNQIVSQGYYDSIKGFVDAVEGKNMRVLSSLEHLSHTYSLIENIRTLI